MSHPLAPPPRWLRQQRFKHRFALAAKAPALLHTKPSGATPDDIHCHDHDTVEIQMKAKPRFIAASFFYENFCVVPQRHAACPPPPPPRPLAPPRL
jgi:hypothetical protein